MLISNDVDARRQWITTASKPPNNGSIPPQLCVFAERYVLVSSGSEASCPRMKFAFKAPHRGSTERSAVDAFGTRIGSKVEPFELADDFAANGDSAGVVEREIENLFFPEA